MGLLSRTTMDSLTTLVDQALLKSKAASSISLSCKVRATLAVSGYLWHAGGWKCRSGLGTSSPGCRRPPATSAGCPAAASTLSTERRRTLVKGEHPRPAPGGRPTLQTHSGSQTIPTPVLTLLVSLDKFATFLALWKWGAHSAPALAGASQCPNFKPINNCHPSSSTFSISWTIDKQTKILSDVSPVWSYDGPSYKRQLNPITQPRGLSHNNHCTNRSDTDIQR